ncbi:uncharacterized protein [Muntiacus reevesi]|uniref:uncharacterized protein n=1 Tax=Muntiacus reevesi TaxID=9886 RepID=UPI0033075C13
MHLASLAPPSLSLPRSPTCPLPPAASDSRPGALPPRLPPTARPPPPGPPLRATRSLEHFLAPPSPASTAAPAAPSPPSWTLLTPSCPPILPPCSPARDSSSLPNPSPRKPSLFPCLLLAPLHPVPTLPLLFFNSSSLFCVPVSPPWSLSVPALDATLLPSFPRALSRPLPSDDLKRHPPTSDSVLSLVQVDVDQCPVL